MNQSDTIEQFDKQNKISTIDFDAVYKLLNQSFPINEQRTKADQMKLLQQDDYKIIVRRTKRSIISAFLAIWEFEKIRYIEHFAVDEHLRGSGIGGDFLRAYLNRDNRPVMLEVELDTCELCARRINFYKRYGFALNEYAYVQPAMQDGQNPLPLHVMSYPFPLSRQEFDVVDTLLKSRVYAKR
ncbi:MAG: GNAT family N-acetyltransferase [Christensenellaceae bacterium]